MRRIVRRTIPHSYFEPEALETWLEAQAREGLFLTDHIPRFLPWHHFARGTPAPIRYRVLLSKKELNQKEREQAAAQGWRYLSRYGKANLLTTADPHAHDLRRNWEDLAALRRQARRLYCNNLVITCFLLLSCFVFIIWNGWTGSALSSLLVATADYHFLSFWTGVIYPPLALFLILFLIRGYVHLPKETDPPYQPKPIKVSPPLHKAAFFLRQWLGGALCLLLLVQPLLPGPSVYSPVDLTQPEWEALPYPLLQDLEGPAQADCLVFRGRHLLAPSLLDVRQYGNDTSYQLHVYHTRSPWLARWFTKGCLSYFCHGYTAGDPIDHTASLPPHDLDFAAYYTVSAPADFPWSYTRHILILREGTTVIEVDYDGSADILTLLPQYASALTSP